MELDLGLTLKTFYPIQGFDLNKCWFEPNEKEGSDGLRQVDPVQIRDCAFNNWEKIDENRLEIGLGGNGQKMSPLVSWNEEPNEEDDGGRRGNPSCQLVSSLDPLRHLHLSTLNSINKTICRNLEDEENYAEGWPPIQSWRKKFIPSPNSYRGGNPPARRGPSSMYVKVKMQGVAIGRKINIRCYDSYDNLFDSLTSMFTKYIGNVDDHNTTSILDYYTLKFLDRDGNWLQEKDVPWQMLVECVQRIEIRRKING